MSAQQIFQIDIHQVLRTKVPQLYKKIPDSLINAFAKFLCIEQLNIFLRENSDARGTDLMEKFLESMGIQFHIYGEENFPDATRKCIFASNHPLGGLDGVCLSVIVGKKYDKHIRYFVNDILYFIEPLQDIFIPINKHGAQGREAAAAINEALASDNQIITFPAGLCSRKSGKKITDLEWKKMVVTKAIEYKRDIIPIYFEAKNSDFFYNFANIRKKIGVKSNIEFVFLPREMFKAKKSTFNIYFGKPISHQTFDSSRSPQQWTDWLKNQVYQLKNNTLEYGHNHF